MSKLSRLTVIRGVPQNVIGKPAAGGEPALISVPLQTNPGSAALMQARAYHRLMITADAAVDCAQRSGDKQAEASADAEFMSLWSLYREDICEAQLVEPSSWADLTFLAEVVAHAYTHRLPAGWGEAAEKIGQRMGDHEDEANALALAFAVLHLVRQIGGHAHDR